MIYFYYEQTRISKTEFSFSVTNGSNKSKIIL